MGQLPPNHPMNKLKRKAPGSNDTAMANADAWRNGGYQKWKEGDAQREKELPPGGVAPQRPEPQDTPPSSSVEQDKRKINGIRKWAGNTPGRMMDPNSTDGAGLRWSNENTPTKKI